jgi:uncharacterized protein YdaU (DUF1376 family)
MNFYKRHLGDFTKHTAHLSALQVGVYDLLLDFSYISEAPLPLDIKQLESISRVTNRATRNALQVILNQYFRRTANGYVNKRVEEELAEANSRSSKAQRAANVRWQSGKDDANALQTHMQTQCAESCERNASQTPDSRLHKKPKDKGAPDDDRQTHARTRGNGPAASSSSSSPLASEIVAALRQQGARRPRDAQDRLAEAVRLGVLPSQVIDSCLTAREQKPGGFTANYALGIVLNRIEEGFYDGPMPTVDPGPVTRANGRHHGSKADRDSAFMAAIRSRGSNGDVIDIEAAEVHHVAE